MGQSVDDGVPTTVKDALRYTPLAVYPIQLTSKCLFRPSLEYNHGGILHLLSPSEKVANSTVSKARSVCDLIGARDLMALGTNTHNNGKAADLNKEKTVSILSKYLSKDAMDVLTMIRESVTESEENKSNSVEEEQAVQRGGYQKKVQSNSSSSDLVSEKLSLLPVADSGESSVIGSSEDTSYRLVEPSAKLYDPIEKRERLYDTLLDLLESILDDSSGILGIWKSFQASDGYSYRVLSDNVLTNIDITTRLLLGFHHTDNSVSLYRILQIIPKVFPVMLRSLHGTEWSSDLAQLTNRATTCTCILRAFRFGMQFARPELYPEDALSGSLDFLSGYIDQIASVPVKSDRTVSADLNEWLVDYCFSLLDAIRSLQYIVANSSSTDSVVATKLEYLALNLAFIGANAADSRTPVLKRDHLNSLRKEGCILLTVIFRSYPTQRDFIFHEVLTSMEKVPAKDNHQKRIWWKGHYVEPTTFLLLNFLEIQGIIDPESMANLQNLRFSSEKASDSRILLETHLALTKTKDRFDSSNLYVVRFITDKYCASNSSLSGYRLAVEYLIKDLVDLVFDPLWPSACHLLSFFILFLSSPNTAESFNSTALLSLAVDVSGAAIFALVPFMKMKPHIEFKKMDSAQFIQYYDKSRAVASLVKRTETDATELDEIKMAHCFIESCYLFNLSGIVEQGDDENCDQKLVALARQLVLSASKKSTTVLPEWKGGLEEKESEYLDYLQYQPISGCFLNCFSVIERTAQDARATLRYKAVGAISSLIDSKPEFSQNKGVLEIIKAALTDASTQVRNIAVEVVSKLIVRDDTLIPKLYKLLCEKSYDKGVAVRKRTIKVLRELFILTSDKSIKLDLAECILDRIEDVEQSISTLAVQSICDIVFKGNNRSEKEPPFSEGDSDSDDSDDGEITRLYGPPESTSLNIVFLETLAQRKPGTLSCFFELCFSNDVEKVDISRFVNKASVQAAFKVTAADIVTSIATSPESELLEGIRLLHIIISSSSIVLKQDQLRDLECCLALEDQSGQVCNDVLDILQHSLDRVQVLSPFFLKHLEKTLSARLGDYKVDTSKIVQCLTVVYDKIGANSRLPDALLHCLSELEHYKSKSSLDHKFMRLLQLSSSFARYCHSDVHGLEVNSQDLPNIYERTIDFLLRFTRHEKLGRGRKSSGTLFPRDVRCLALKCIGEICIGHPRYFLKKDVIELLDSVMLNNLKAIEWQGTEFKDVVLVLIRDLISSDDRKVRLSVKRKSTVKLEQPSRKRRNVEGFKASAFEFLSGASVAQMEDSVPVGLLQRYLDQILDASVSAPGNTSLSALQLLETAVRHGYAHPRKCVPSLMALESSWLEPYSRLAKQAHSYLQERYASVVEGCYPDGVKTVYQYQHQCRRQGSEESLGEGVLSTFYEVAHHSKNIRRKFFSALMTNFQFDPFRTSPEDLMEHWNFTAFISRALSSLDFTTQDEVLTVIQAIDEELSTSGTALLSRIEEEDEEEPDPCVGISAGILWMYWRLRVFLKELYGFSEAKCREFSPVKRAAREVKLTSRFSDDVTKPIVVDLAKMEQRLGTAYDIMRIQQFVETMKEEAVSKYEDFGLEDDD